MKQKLFIFLLTTFGCITINAAQPLVAHLENQQQHSYRRSGKTPASHFFGDTQTMTLQEIANQKKLDRLMRTAAALQAAETAQKTKRGAHLLTAIARK